MTAAKKLKLTSVEDYLAGEVHSEVKHEYLGGFTYAMAGGRNVHNAIAGNVFGILHAKLRGKPCRPFNSDTKVRIQLPTHVRFYYPDVSVVCDENPPEESFQDRPIVIVEVVSASTQRIDHGEKRDSYLTIPSLQQYILLEQSAAAATVYRRTEEGFVREFCDESQAAIELVSLGVDITLAEIYEGVTFAPESTDEDPV